MSEQNHEEIQQETEAISFAEFLENTPPNGRADIEDLTTADADDAHTVGRLLAPEILLHCPNEVCHGPRVFRCIDSSVPEISHTSRTYFYLSYRCSNCRRTMKIFALAAQRDEDATSGRCYKLGEDPGYGPPTPACLMQLIGPDRELFLKGRRCENQGLGIGAFVYYRSVVENQKNRMLDEIIKASEKLSLPLRDIEKLQAAKSEPQWSTASESVKDALPQALLLHGQNPLTLLHSALSKGVHESTDKNCLDMAQCLRVVLVELSERLGQVLKDEEELKHALAKLVRSKNHGESDGCRESTSEDHPAHAGSSWSSSPSKVPIR